MTKLVFSCAADVKAYEGREIGVSDWILVDQDRINRFADATEDHQWIHVDVERAKREMPIGTTIAHGYLLISLMPKLLDTFVEFQGLKRVINYGLNEVRFKNMVPAGKRVRMRAELKSARQRAGGLPQHFQRPGIYSRSATVAVAWAVRFRVRRHRAAAARWPPLETNARRHRPGRSPRAAGTTAIARRRRRRTPLRRGR